MTSLVTIKSPIGDVCVVERDGALIAVSFAVPRMAADATVVARTPVSDAIARYVDGDIAAIDDLAAAPTGTPFQEQVWAALRDIPAGDVISYGELARRVGNPNAGRAVGAANGANPVAIVIPCHRVIGANGTLTGYASGIKRKRWLLDHERRQTELFAAGSAHEGGKTS